MDVFIIGAPLSDGRRLATLLTSPGDTSPGCTAGASSRRYSFRQRAPAESGLGSGVGNHRCDRATAVVAVLDAIGLIDPGAKLGPSHLTESDPKLLAA
jgi:hypothetical protein